MRSSILVGWLVGYLVDWLVRQLMYCFAGSRAFECLVYLMVDGEEKDPSLKQHYVYLYIPSM